MKKLNLLPPELQQRHEVNIRRLLIKVLTLFGLLLILALVGLGQYKLMVLEKQLAALEIQRQSLFPYRENMIKFEQQLNEVEEKIRELTSLIPPSVQASSILKQASEAAPEDVWLTRVELSSGQDNTEGSEQVQQFNLILSGYSQTVSSVALYSYYLNQLTELTNVTVAYSTIVEINDREIVEFLITAGIFP